MSKLAAAAALLLTALLLVACGDDDGPKAPADEETAAEGAPAEGIAGGPDPCTVLDESAVADAIGASVEGERDAQFGLDQCAYEGERGEIGTVTPALYVTLGDASAFGNYQNPDLDPQPVEGVGEEAILLQGTSRATGGGSAGLTIVARTDDRTVIVAWSLGGEPGQTAPDQADLERLTEQVLAAL